MDIVLGCVKQHSDGSSPVTTTNVNNSLFVNIHLMLNDYRVKYIGL